MSTASKHHMEKPTYTYGTTFSEDASDDGSSVPPISRALEIPSNVKNTLSEQSPPSMFRRLGTAKQWVNQQKGKLQKQVSTRQAERQRRSSLVGQKSKEIQLDQKSVKVDSNSDSENDKTDHTANTITETNNNDNSITTFIKIDILPEPPSKHPFCPHILSQKSMKKIASAGFPASLLFSKWKRLYSLSRDGDSFETMLRLVERQNKTLLVIKTTRGELFGGFTDTVWEGKHSKSVGGVFYGGGTAFLFKLDQSIEDCNEDEVDGGEYQGEAKVYNWTGMNNYIQFCEITTGKIAMGGGGLNGSFGLCLEDDFKRGSTGECDTFMNEPLANQEQFNIMDLEIWGFVAGIF